MGIKNLLKFLSSYEGIVNILENDNDYKKEKVAIDISIVLYKVIIAIRNSGADLTNKSGDIVSHLLGLFNKTIYLLKKNIIPIYVFDGGIPDMKKKVLDNRREMKKKAWEKMEQCNDEKERIKYFKRTVSISNKQIKECKKLLDLMGVPYVQAPEEADSQCAQLVKDGIADSVFTEDMDILTFGSSKIYRNLDSYKKNTIEIKLDDILMKINLNYDQFIELCLLFGCDYWDGLRDISSYVVYDIYIKYKNIPDTIDYFKNIGYCVPDYNEYNKYKNYFINAPYKIIENIELKKANIDLLTDFLVNKCSLVKSKIINKIEFLDNLGNSL
jgi:flap endonuclease-1